MSVRSGRYGKVTTTGGETFIKSWTLSRKADLYDSTNFDDSTGGRSYVAGFIDWSGSFEGYYSTSNVLAPGGTGQAIILSTTGSTGTGAFSGTAIITGMDIVTGVDGLVTQAYTFQGTGTLTQTTA